ncbi:GNAT family N-acetyltransferase [Sphingobacterium wenxiniae]|uniref:Acetyltransferase (GNAT) family protein n=1 Tax=Sphingobacterium wenxiniae TaxID=683125 RepID=A0A1I6TLV7_9SPHI|nr:GNAT family N-acetyltransferase [Sphingobacterium wenxiniae]SFS90154.1 Acetyltransferase (GNAT) family protein [Sphingobacterium wenxiniae]
MITLRRAHITDATQLASIMLLAMEDIIYYFIGKRDYQEAVAFLQYWIEQPCNQYSYENILVAEEKGEILGQICLYPGEDLDKLRSPILQQLKEKYGQDFLLEAETQAGEIYIDTIAVSTNAQGKGIGKKLLHYAIDEYVYKRKQTLGLLVDKDNPDAKKLYLKVGFKAVNECHIFQKDMEHLQF